MTQWNYFHHGGDVTKSLVVAQQNYNEMRWKQRNLSVSNGAKAKVQRGASCRNSTIECCSQKLQIKGVLRQPGMLILEVAWSLIQIFIGFWMIWDRKWDTPKTYTGYKVHFSLFLDIAGESEEGFDTEWSLKAYSSTVPITRRTILCLQAESCRSMPLMLPHILMQIPHWTFESETRDHVSRMIFPSGILQDHRHLSKPPYCTTQQGAFQNAHELLILRAIKISMLHKNHIFQCMGKIFCTEF